MQTTVSEWLEYDWHIDGLPARIAVDLALREDAPSPVMSVLLYINCSSRDPGDSQLTAGELRRAARLHAKVMKEAKPLYVGYVDMPGQRQMYYYVDSESVGVDIGRLCQKQPGLITVSGTRREPQWQTYFGLLYPDAAKYQTVLNREQAERLARQGDDNTMPRRINLHMGFPTEMKLLYFIDDAKREGFAVGEREFMPELETPYSVTLHRAASLMAEDIDDVTTRAIYAAQRFEGVLIMWDCQFVPKSSPLR